MTDEDHVMLGAQFQKEQEKLSRVESLRRQLIALREGEIKPAFPDAPAEKGLLRKTLLEEFILKRPNTRADWFRAFPESIRTSVDSRQISQYLDRVLKIVAECGGLCGSVKGNYAIRFCDSR